MRIDVVADRTLYPISTQIGKLILFQDQYRESYRPDIKSLIVEAVVQNKSIKIVYFSIHRDATSERIIDPY